MKLHELEWRTRQLVGTAHTDDDIESPAEAQDAVNDAYLEVAHREKQWPWLINRWAVPTHGRQRVVMPPEVAAILHIGLPHQDLALTVRTPARFADDREGAAGTPKEYAVDRDEVWLRPPPTDDIVLDVRGLMIPHRLGRDDEPLFNPAWHHMLAYYAAADMLLRRPTEGEDPRVARYKQRANMMFEEMSTFYRRSYDQQPVIVGGRDHHGPRHARPAGRRPEVW